jgi:hypothetical protein
MLRVAWWLFVAAAACTPAQAPTARRVGEVLSIAGVIGIVGSAATRRETGKAGELIIGFSVMSAVGIVMYAVGELSDPAFQGGPLPETIPDRNHRWARILSERAAGAARDGNCERVRRLEARVRHYDAEVHDFVLMRDPEILRCLETAAPAAP